MKSTVLFPVCIAALLFFCSCEKKQASDQLEDIKKKVDVVFTQTSNIQGQLTSLEQPSYFLHDTEHKKTVGILKQTSSPQVGHFIIWDDDVYQVEAIRLHTEKQGEEKLNKTTVNRTLTVEVFVKFVSKLTPSE